eukprot:CAMPEP_0119384662 /NCGR_PEP_ID=MMETSP1334-20130426/86854_1 /TAXON_ID=127549 /ORGANISM="Calcidiscus leptoporus, Strain RCC1130" /LENGTH=65 /DNA_ID=CAMNT_0007405729 /DNA_START=1 /DNA_END=198 /DNA_ORIENTATION=-
MPCAVPLPLQPQVRAVFDARLHCSVAKPGIARVLKRAVEAAPVRLDAKDFHHAARAVHKDLAPHA